MTEIELSTLIRNYTLSLSAVFMGGWAFWKWGFSEWLRHRQEGPAVDGVVTTTKTPLINNDSQVLATIEATWRNKGVYPVYIDTEQTRLDVFEITSEYPEGPIYTNKDLGDPAYRMYPYKDMKGFILEPNTESILQHHFILSVDKIYLLRWKLYRNQAHHKGGRYAWTKELPFQFST